MAAKKKAITWTNERRKLSDLIPWERNPRTIKNAQAERLVDCVETFGQVEALAVGPANQLYNGHQRLSVLAGQYGMDYEVDVRVASRELTERERQQLTVYLHKGAAGEWDFDELANWGIEDDLVTWGFDDIAAIVEAAQASSISEDVTTSTDRDMGDKRKQIKPVLYADEVGDFEKAILATGVRNRGEAILTICRFYLEQHGDWETERQFDVSFENVSTQKFAKAGR